MGDEPSAHSVGTSVPIPYFSQSSFFLAVFSGAYGLFIYLRARLCKSDTFSRVNTILYCRICGREHGRCCLALESTVWIDAETARILRIEYSATPGLNSLFQWRNTRSNTTR